MAEGDNMDRLRIPVSLDRLQELQAHVRRRACELDFPAENLGRLDLVMEELVVNIIRYAYQDGQGELEVRCLQEEEPLHHYFCVQLRDWGPAFNPLEQKSPDLELDVDERPFGGLGIFLAEQMTDGIRYERRAGSNVLSCYFQIEPLP